MLRTRLLTATAAIALFGAGSAFAQEQTAPTAPPQTSAPAEAVQAQTPAAGNTVVDVLRAQGQFSTLLSALDAAQLTETLTTQPAVSIFAPTDAAFAALPEAERTRLLDPANVNELRQLLLYHVIVADVNSSQIEGAAGGVETAARTQVQLDGTGDAIKVDAATVTQADIDAGNGAIFVIDRVLNPAQSLVATGDAEEAAPAAPAAPVPPTASATPPASETMPDSTVNPPNGQPAESTTTVASPPVLNPTDGQQDDTTKTEEPQS
jgi:uncharacterized surface protein with fasciclin (FAS1) repeats